MNGLMKLLLPLIVAIIFPFVLAWAYPTWRNKLAAVRGLRQFLKSAIVIGGLYLTLITMPDSQNLSLHFGLGIGLMLLAMWVFDTVVFKKTSVERQYDAHLAVGYTAQNQLLKEGFQKTKLGKIAVSLPVVMAVILIFSAAAIFAVFHFEQFHFEGKMFQIIEIVGIGVVLIVGIFLSKKLNRPHNEAAHKMNESEYK